MVNKELTLKKGFTLKRCPKCGGNIFMDMDLRGWYEECLQCGHTLNLPDLVDTDNNIRPAVNSSSFRN